MDTTHGWILVKFSMEGAEEETEAALIKPAQWDRIKAFLRRINVEENLDAD